MSAFARFSQLLRVLNVVDEHGGAGNVIGGPMSAVGVAVAQQVVRQQQQITAAHGFCACLHEIQKRRSEHNFHITRHNRDRDSRDNRGGDDNLDPQADDGDVLFGTTDTATHVAASALNPRTSASFMETASMTALDRLSDGMLAAVEQRKTLNNPYPPNQNNNSDIKNEDNIADDYDDRGLSSADAFFSHVSAFEQGLLTAVKSTLGGPLDHGDVDMNDNYVRGGNQQAQGGDHQGLFRCFGAVSVLNTTLNAAGKSQSRISGSTSLCC